MNSVIAFFSSDRRPLYKADVFRTLALPEDYILQFRYDKSYVHTNLLSQLPSLKGKTGQIIFAAGNESENQTDKLKYHPIRLVTIVDVEDEQEIDKVIFYLQLKEFSDATLLCPPEDCQPPKIFVSNVKVQDSHSKSWIERVRVIEKDFGSALFFHISSITRRGRCILRNNILPRTSPNKRSSYYALIEERQYDVKISFYDSEGGSRMFSAVGTNDEVVLSIPDSYRVGATADTQIFQLHTHTRCQNS